MQALFRLCHEVDTCFKANGIHCNTPYVESIIVDNSPIRRLLKDFL